MERIVWTFAPAGSGARAARRPPRHRRPVRPAALLGLAAALFAAAPGRAELVVFDDGGYLKVTSYELLADPATGAERMRLVLPSKGVLTVALSRIDRVVDDEIAPQPEPVEEEVADLELAVGFAEGQPVPATPYGSLIYEASRRHGVNPRLVAAVVRAESGFDVAALSRKGARGLMQLMPATARRFGVAERDLFDPRRNVEAGVRYLRWLLDRFSGDLARVLAAYNAGEGTVERYGGVPPYRETRSYIHRVYASLGLGSGLP